jgi:hypothetical protein
VVPLPQQLSALHCGEIGVPICVLTETVGAELHGSCLFHEIASPIVADCVSMVSDHVAAVVLRVFLCLGPADPFVLVP